MAPKKSRNRRNKEAADAEKSKSKSKSEASPSSPLPTASTAATSCVLPQKIILSILSRLPVNSLVRFKRVCKQWKSLVNYQEFIKIHYNRFSETPKTWYVNSRILDCSKLGLVPHKKADRMDDDSKYDFVLEICKGLICLARPLTTDRIILWNPATRLWKVLPDPTKRHQGTAQLSSLGFGCNEEGNDHKVVRIHSMKGKETTVYVEVYSSKSDNWKTVDAGLAFRPLSAAHAVEVSGNPHWVVLNERNDMGVLRFDSKKMSFEAIVYPSSRGGKGALKFVDVRGCIGALQCRKRKNDSLDNITVLAYVNEQWIDLWSVEAGRGGLRKLQVDFCLGYSWRKEKIVGRCLNGSVFEYDLNEGSVRVFGVETGATGFLHLSPFEESLAHVRGMAAMDLAAPAADDYDKLKNSISSGFFTWMKPREAAEFKVFYPLAC